MGNNADLLTELADLHATTEWGEAFLGAPSQVLPANQLPFTAVFDLLKSEPETANGRQVRHETAELHVLDATITLSIEQVVKRVADSAFWAVAGIFRGGEGETVYTLTRDVEVKRGQI